jgi:hypothetical protein
MPGPNAEFTRLLSTPDSCTNSSAIPAERSPPCPPREQWLPATRTAYVESGESTPCTTMLYSRSRSAILSKDGGIVTTLRVHRIFAVAAAPWLPLPLDCG